LLGWARRRPSRRDRLAVVDSSNRWSRGKEIEQAGRGAFLQGSRGLLTALRWRLAARRWAAKTPCRVAERGGTFVYGNTHDFRRQKLAISAAHYAPIMARSSQSWASRRQGLQHGGLPRAPSWRASLFGTSRKRIRAGCLNLVVVAAAGVGVHLDLANGEPTPPLVLRCSSPFRGADQAASVSTPEARSQQERVPLCLQSVEAGEALGIGEVKTADKAHGVGSSAAIV